MTVLPLTQKGPPPILQQEWSEEDEEKPDSGEECSDED